MRLFWGLGPGAAHGHRSQSHRSLRRPSHRRRCVAVNSPARPRRSQRAPQPGPAATAQVSCPDLTCRIAETVPNFARNSPATISNIEFRSLELQRFGALLNVHPIELRATFWGRGPATAHVGAAARPSYALRSLRRPPHRRRLVADVWLGASARCPARTRLSASMSHVIPLRVFQMLN